MCQSLPVIEHRHTISLRWRAKYQLPLTLHRVNKLREWGGRRGDVRVSLLRSTDAVNEVSMYYGALSCSTCKRYLRTENYDVVRSLC